MIGPIMETYIPAAADYREILGGAMDNNKVAAIFYEVADILDLQGVAFKPNAYRRAARSLEDLSEDVSKIVDEDRLKEIPGVGESFAKKIEEIVKTGQLEYLNRLKAQIPPGLQELLTVPDVGPKKAMVLYKELGISNLEELKKAALEHKLRGIKGFGEKTEERIIQGIGTVESKGRRMLLGQAYPVADRMVNYLKS
ncbi:MAG TPA: helix-hairpin-helix domain-containing protein, partial [Thermoplasmata archaeon]|nr:helix-hairpin-helix domain-containing protein [Thermoplasmata archaeon]